MRHSFAGNKLSITWTIRSTILATFMFSVLCNCFPYEEDKDYWYKNGNKELVDALKMWMNNETATNVIVFVGDGMDPNTVTATRIYKVKENGKLSFEKFPHIGLLKTYSVDKQVPDSASSATALFTGVKTNNELIGFDARVRPRDCSSSSPSSRISSIMEWAQETGKDTGFVTTTRVTHATPSALYAHSASRNWECDTQLPERSFCKDIARQLFEDSPGRNFKVVFGGGRQGLMPQAPSTVDDKADYNACSRSDTNNLIFKWEEDKRQRNVNYKYVQNAEELKRLDIRNTDYVLGIFANSHMSFEGYRNHHNKQQPSLMNMTEAAIHILMKNRNGFFLMVESGLIDIAHHEGHARLAIEETAHFDATIERSLQVLTRYGLLNNTLIIVTGDHGHTMSINGYPERGSSVFGIAQKSNHDDIAYTTLTYSTGKKNNYRYDKEGRREDPARQDTFAKEYAQQAAILTDEETHGGGDITVYAMGPKAHLFHSVHEQTYVANVISFAANVGPYRVNSAAIVSVHGLLLAVTSILCAIPHFINK